MYVQFFILDFRVLVNEMAFVASNFSDFFVKILPPPLNFELSKCNVMYKRSTCKINQILALILVKL